MTRGAEFKTLGLSQDASWDDVKRAFRKMARIYHPDVAGPDGTRKFAEITEAYMCLKELTSPGFGKVSANPARRNENRAREESEPKESIFRKFWNMLFSRESERTGKNAGEDGVSPARVRFIGSAISRAESEMMAVMSRRDEFTVRNRTDALIRRLRSRHPAVVTLALRQLSVCNVKDEIASAMVEHFKRNLPAPETLERVLDVFSNSPLREELSRVMLTRLDMFSDEDAMTLLSRLKRWKSPQSVYKKFLSHHSPAVVAYALSRWPPEGGDGGNADLTALLKKEEETILVPLLRILRREKLPHWTAARMEKLMREHPSPAVRVWASSIVRDQNLS
jgi:hypothetical protein